MTLQDLRVTCSKVCTFTVSERPYHNALPLDVVAHSGQVFPSISCNVEDTY